MRGGHHNSYLYVSNVSETDSKQVVKNCTANNWALPTAAMPLCIVFAT